MRNMKTCSFDVVKPLFIALLAAACFRAELAGAAEPAKLDPNMPYRAARSKPVTYDVDFSVVVTPPYKCKSLKVWLPLPPTDSAQTVTEVSLDTFPLAVTPKIGAEKTFGNTFAFFDFEDAQGAQIIRHKFKVQVWELQWNLDPDKIVAVADWPETFERYRRGESQAVVADKRFDELLGRIVPKRGNPLLDMSAVMDWMIQDFKYDHVDASLEASALHALEKHHGHCSDYHGFCASMGRALGYPTRVTYGINPLPKNSPSHCKLEVFLAPYGWVSFDISETQNLLAAIRDDSGLDGPRRQKLLLAAKQRLLRGFRDNTWFLQTKGTDYDLEPPASKRVPVVRTIYAEADGASLPDPDPANKELRAFAWMTVCKFVPDRPVRYPFKDFDSLDESVAKLPNADAAKQSPESDRGD
jgi:transglutaminase-like putative cysteine protease